MADDRARWTDERLDDFAKDIRSDVADIKAVLGNMQSAELQQLRDRATRAESAVQAGRTRRIGYVLTVGVPLLAAALGALVGDLLAHAF